MHDDHFDVLIKNSAPLHIFKKKGRNKKKFKEEKKTVDADMVLVERERKVIFFFWCLLCPVKKLRNLTSKNFKAKHS